jgi:putative membrane protein
MKKIITLACACLFALAAPIAGAHAHKSDATVSGLDKQSLKTSIEGDMFEIAGGKLALHRSHNPAVLKLARRLVTDHSKSLQDSVKLARKLGIDVPHSPAPSMVWELKVVASLHGRAFNHWYSSLEVYDHQQDIQETTDEIQDGTNSEVVANAKTELPVLKEHLALAERALAASK